MRPKPIRPEIDYHTSKLIVGVIALLLTPLTCSLSHKAIESISASYHAGGTARDVFVGSLFAIFAFLLAYNGHSTYEMILSKIAACAALGVAIVPCECNGHLVVVPRVHGISATVMFVILAALCREFYQRARKKTYRQAQWRATLYAICGTIIVASILILAIDKVSNHSISARIARLTFYGEATALFAFGIAWIVGSRCLPIITHPKERIPFSPFRESPEGS